MAGKNLQQPKNSYCFKVDSVSVIMSTVSVCDQGASWVTLITVIILSGAMSTQNSCLQTLDCRITVVYHSLHLEITIIWNGPLISLCSFIGSLLVS